MKAIHACSAALVAIVLSLTAVACGSSSSSGSSTTVGDVPATQSLTGKTGGTLTVLASDDVDYIDPGAAYGSFSYMVMSATQRFLYAYGPDDAVDPVPSLATQAPDISADGKTVTVKIKPNVKFSPPVNRVVTSADVKYGIERAFLPTVQNVYAGDYFGDIIGVKAFKDGKATEISGIDTPDATTIVFNLNRGTGEVVAGALTLPISAPVPKEYAAKFDAKNPSTYGVNQVATGPYMIEADAKGALTGYEPGKKINLVRNPNWDRSTDFRKAYLDKINIEEGNNDATVASRQILKGNAEISGDFVPPPAVLKQISSSSPDQLELPPAGGIDYVSLNTTLAPFDNLNVRKAVLAAFDREAMRATRGGSLQGPVANHFIAPGVGGFEEAGGLAGTGVDFLKYPKGNLALAKEYMKKGGFPSGMYTGSDELLMVGVSGGAAQKAAELAATQFEKLGFKPKLRLVTQETMFNKFCGVPKAKVSICPNVGWFKDFSDPQTMLDPTFNGKNIVDVNNQNIAQLNVASINSAMDQAELIVGQSARHKAWAEIDRQVTAQAPAVPLFWIDWPNTRSADVAGVINQFNSLWDLSFTSLK
ncbi:MAG: ABC transporter substrate-binding protein [Solirubrobacterales bacterium]|nr:ABC transporter substrate-binding protein [Solirubrobacterales bacterium]